MKSILFVDVLGVKSRWISGGRNAAEEVFLKFQDIVSKAIRKKNIKRVLCGAVETDSAVLVCESLFAATTIGRDMFRLAFRVGNKKTDKKNKKIWLRGIIIPANKEANNLLRTKNTLKNTIPQVEVYKFSNNLLDAIAAEKSGFKGMRLLIIGFGKSVRETALAISCDGISSFRPLKCIVPPGYPVQLGDGVYDYMWMASTNEEKWKEMNRIMTYRLRDAAENSEEFIQAAATQIVFTHCGQMFGSFQKSLKNKTCHDA